MDTMCRRSEGPATGNGRGRREKRSQNPSQKADQYPIDEEKQITHVEESRKKGNNVWQRKETQFIKHFQCSRDIHLLRPIQIRLLLSTTLSISLPNNNCFIVN